MKKTIILGVILIIGISFLVEACPFGKSEYSGYKDCKFENGEECPFAGDGSCPLNEEGATFKKCAGCAYKKDFGGDKTFLPTWKLMPFYGGWHEKRDFRFHSWKYGGYKGGGCDKSKFLEEYDLNGDGEITVEEKKAFFLEEYDLDGDGQITWEEKKAVWESK